MAFRERLEQGDALGADRQAVSRVLDVAAGDDCAAGRAQGRALLRHADVKDLLDLEQQKLAAAVLLCGAPNVPLLFMGQEWSERAPFLYFTSHTDGELGRAVRRGRMEEYDAFVRGEGETESTLGGFADPQSELTFERSKLDWDSPTRSPHAEVLSFYRDLIATRTRYACLSNCDKALTRVAFDEASLWLTVERGDRQGVRALLACNFRGDAQSVPVPAGAWRLALWSGDASYGGDAALAPPPASVEAAAQTEVEVAGWGAALYVNAE